MEPLLIFWFYRLLFICLSFLILVINLIPIGFSSAYLTFPDLLYCLTACWVIRRPNYIPTPMVVCLFLFQDILLGLPIGLGTVIYLAIIEYLRSRIEVIRYQSFLMEWGIIAISYFIFIFTYQLALIITFSQPSTFGTLAFLLVETIFIYPVIVFLSTYILKVKSPHFPKVEAN